MGQRVCINLDADIRPPIGARGEIPAGATGAAGSLRFYPPAYSLAEQQELAGNQRWQASGMGRQDPWWGAHEFKRRFIRAGGTGFLEVYDLGARLADGSYEDLDLSSLTTDAVKDARLAAILGDSPLGKTGTGDDEMPNSPQLANDDDFGKVELVKNPSTGKYHLVAPTTQFFFGFDTAAAGLKITTAPMYGSPATTLPDLSPKSKIRAFIIPMVCKYTPAFYTWHHYSAKYYRTFPFDAGKTPYTLAGDYPDTVIVGSSGGTPIYAPAPVPVVNPPIYDRLPAPGAFTLRNSKVLVTRAFARALGERVADKGTFTLPDWSNPTPFKTDRLAPSQMWINVGGTHTAHSSTDFESNPDYILDSGLAVSYLARDTGQLTVRYRTGTYPGELAGIVEIKGVAYYIWRTTTSVNTGSAITADRHQEIPATTQRAPSWATPATLPAIAGDDEVDFVPLSIAADDITPVGIYLGDDDSTVFTVDHYSQARTFTDYSKQAPPYSYVTEDYQP